MLARLTLAAAISVAGGCSIPLPPPSAHHPASPEAPEAPLPDRSSTLNLDTADPIGSAEVSPPAVADHGRTHAGDHSDAHEQHVATQRAGDSNTAPPSGEGPRSPAQAVFVCPMHPDVVSNQPGKCPKCYMKLVKRSAPAQEHGDHP